MNSFTHFRVLRTMLVCSAVLATSTTATAASTCPFDTGGSDAVNDGLVLTRYALGITGAPMTASTRYASLDPLQVKNNIECVGCALDMNGDGQIDSVDTTIIARHLAGFSGASLTAGLALGSAPTASRPSLTAITSFLASGCAAGGAINAFTNGGNAFGATAVIGTTDAQDLNIRSGGNLVEGAFDGSAKRFLLLKGFVTSAGTAISSVFDTSDLIAGSAKVVQGSSSNISNSAGSTISGGGSSGSNCLNPFDGSYTHPCRNEATEEFSTVGGGQGNFISNYSGGAGSNGTISGGVGNSVYGSRGTIAGGQQNLVLGAFSSIGGGARNKSDGGYSTVPGGSDNSATGNNSFAAGRNARATDDNSFVYGARSTVTNSAGPGSFLVSVPGNIVFYATNTAGIGCTLSLAGWVCTSDRATKQGIRDLNVRDVLKRVVNLAVPSWEFIGATDNRHIGPMAQDFKKAFGLGDTDKAISAMDMGGVALAAIQGLNQKVTAQGSVIRAKDSEIAKLKARLAAIEKRLGL